MARKILLIEGYSDFNDTERAYFLKKDLGHCPVTDNCPAFDLRGIPNQSNVNLIPEGGLCAEIVKNNPNARIRCVESLF